MDENALREKLMARAAVAVEAMIAAMKAAPPNNIIGGSEWPVHEAGDRFRQECFQALVGERVAEEEARRAAFSPSPQAARGSGHGAAGA
jgi:hypothetical protein